MGFNHAPPRTRHRAQCQNDTAISSLTSVFDGRVEYIRSSSTGSSRGCLLLRDLAFFFFFFNLFLSKRATSLTRTRARPKEGNRRRYGKKKKKKHRGSRGEQGHDSGRRGKTLIRLIRSHSKMINLTSGEVKRRRPSVKRAERGPRKEGRGRAERKCLSPSRRVP